MAGNEIDWNDTEEVEEELKQEQEKKKTRWVKVKDGKTSEELRLVGNGFWIYWHPSHKMGWKNICPKHDKREPIYNCKFCKSGVQLNKSMAINSYLREDLEKGKPIPYVLEKLESTMSTLFPIKKDNGNFADVKNGYYIRLNKKVSKKNKISYEFTPITNSKGQCPITQEMVPWIKEHPIYKLSEVYRKPTEEWHERNFEEYMKSKGKAIGAKSSDGEKKSEVPKPNPETTAQEEKAESAENVVVPKTDESTDIEAMNTFVDEMFNESNSDEVDY